MKRDYHRDAATIAFVRYGELKDKSTDEYRKKLKNDIIEENKFTDPAKVNQKIESELNKYSGFFDDMYAVEKVFDHFASTNQDYVIDAVRSVYMPYPHYPSHKETACRVRAHALKVPVSEKQVYKWLKMARVLFAKKRGLSLEVPPGFTGSER